MVDLSFSSPGPRVIAGVHLRIAPSRGGRDAESFVVRLEGDAGGLPSGQVLAAREFVPGPSAWVFVPLNDVTIGREDYHLTIGTAPASARTKSRVCFLKHASDPPRASHPWSATLRHEGTLAPQLINGPALEPVFVLQFADGTYWGQPYHDVDREPVASGKALAWTFAPAGDTAVTSVVARLDERSRDGRARFRITDPAGAEVGSGIFTSVDRAQAWSPAHEARVTAPLALRSGVTYRFALDVPAESPRARYIHRTPISDFPGTLPAVVARSVDEVAAPYRAPSVRLVSAPAPDAQNLAPNPSFEDDPMIDYFVHADVPGNTTFAHDSERSRGGARSVEIASQQPIGKMSRWLSRNERITATPGAAYAVSVWLKTAGVANEASVVLNFWDGSAWKHLGSRFSQTRLSGNSDWTRIEASGTAPAGTAYVRVEARLDGPGTLWADEVVLTRVDAGAPSPTPGAGPTAKPAPTPTAKPTPRPATPTPRPTATGITPTPRPTPTPTPRITPRPTTAATATPTLGGGACSGRYHVKTSGNDANPGTAASPFRSIQRAASVAAPGDTVCVAAGVYRERVRVSRSGTSGSPIVFQGESGAVVDGGDAHGTGWVNAPEFGQNAQGQSPVWKKRIVFGDGATPEHATLDGKYLLRLRDHDDSGNGFMADCAGNPTGCRGSDRLRNGPRGYNTPNATGTVYQGWTSPGTVDAFFGVSAGMTYIAFKDGGSPNGRNLTFAPRNAGTFHFEASYVTVRGFTIRGSNFPVYLPSGAAHHVTVEDNIIRNGFYAVLMVGGTHDNVIRRNDISLEYGHSLDPTGPWHWFTWSAFRNNSQLARGSVMMSGTGANNEIAHNDIHDAFDGIEEDGSVAAGNGTRVHHNTIRTCLNDAMTINGGVDSRWFDNTMTNVNIGTRFWPSGNGSSVSYYRNRIYQPDSDLVEACLFFYRGSASDTLRVYHNSCSGRYALIFGSTNVGPGFPGLKIYNNVLSAKNLITMNDWAGWTSKFSSSSTRPDVAFNLISGGVPGWMSSSNVSTGRVWAPNATPSWLLAGTGLGIGYDVTRSNAALGMPWAGFAPGYFDGAAPDAGAVQF